MVKLKDIATIQTGVYLKSTPSPDTCYLQVNDFDEEGNIRPTVRPTTQIVDIAPPATMAASLVMPSKCM